MPTLTADQRAELLVEFADLTRLSAAERADLVETAERSPELVAQVLANYQGMSWADPSTPAGARALAILQALGGVASAVGAVASAASGVKGVV